MRLSDVFPPLSSEHLAHRAAVGTKCDHSEYTLGPGIAGMEVPCPPPILQMGKQRARQWGSRTSEALAPSVLIPVGTWD